MRAFQGYSSKLENIDIKKEIKMQTTKILVQNPEIGLSEDNKAKLKSLEIYKDKKHFKFSNGWVDLVYELGKNIEEVCKLANCELPKIEAMYNKYNSLRVDYHFVSPVPQIIEEVIFLISIIVPLINSISTSFCITVAILNPV